MREGKLRCAKPFKSNLADIARLKVAQTGKGTAGHKLTRTYPYGRPHHLNKSNDNAKRVPRWMAAYLINYRFAVDDEHHSQFRKAKPLPFSASAAINETAVAHAISQPFEKGGPFRRHETATHHLDCRTSVGDSRNLFAC